MTFFALLCGAVESYYLFVFIKTIKSKNMENTILTYDVNQKRNTFYLDRTKKGNYKISRDEHLIKKFNNQEDALYWFTSRFGNIEIDFLDYKIVICSNGDGIVLKKDNAGASYECHLGNYSTIEHAQIAAIYFFMIARPTSFATHIMHRLIGSGTWGEFSIFEKVCKSEGVKLPKEITASKCGNFILNFEGEKIDTLK